MAAQTRILRHTAAAGALGLLLAATACTEDHLARREGITLEGGNAKSVNMVQTVTDTMPRSARRIGHDTDGPRMVKAIERYRNPPDPNVTEEGKSNEASVDNSEPRQE
jgi:hypothetical protein